MYIIIMTLAKRQPMLYLLNYYIKEGQAHIDNNFCYMFDSNKWKGLNLLQIGPDFCEMNVRGQQDDCEMALR